MPDALTQSAAGDIIGGTVGDWLVVGWFTPDYRPLAEQFAANLTEYGIPYHLFARAKSAAGWNTHQKPPVARHAMDAYPTKTLVLMDVDCRVNGDLTPITRISGDVGVTIVARRVRLLWPPHKRITVKTLSRVVVFRPTEGARAFATEWTRLCKETHYNGDEAAMAVAILTRQNDTAFSHIDPRYSGTADDEASMVTHVSAHEAAVRGVGSWFKAIERRYFRTGRTKLAKQAGLSTRR